MATARAGLWRAGGAPLAAVRAGLRLGAGQAPERAVQRAGRHVPVPLGVPEGPQPLRRFGLELPQLPFEFLDLPLQGLVPAAGAGDLALGRVEAGLRLAGVLGGLPPVTLGGLGLLPCALGRFRLAPLALRRPGLRR